MVWTIMDSEEIFPKFTNLPLDLKSNYRIVLNQNI
jgi:hypothetical protein